MSQTRPLGLAVLVLWTAAASAGTGGTAERELIAADQARAEAVVAVDIASLEQMLGRDVSYGHSGGEVQGKRDFIDSLRSGARRYRALASEETASRAYGCAGVVTGRALAEVELDGQSAVLTLRYTATYVRDRGRWVLVAYQSTRLPDAPRSSPRQPEPNDPPDPLSRK